MTVSIQVLNLQIPSNENKWKRFTIDSIKLSDEVRLLKQEIAQRLTVTPFDIELIYCGRCLNDKHTLESQNISSGATVHVLRSLNQSKQESSSAHKMEPNEFRQLVLDLRTAVMNPAYRQTIHRLSKPEVFENILAATPGLAEDPIAIAILQDPDLIMQMVEPNTINRVVEAHPALASAASHVAAAVHEESTGSASSAHALASAYLYSLDALSDDDEDMAHFDRTDGLPFGVFPQITQAQLASALAAVGSTPGTSGGSNNSVITHELFSQAMEQAITATSQEGNEAQLQQLRNMGINDEALSLRALEMTNGDVHAALELIFGDFMDTSPRNSSNNN
uniref:Ubiquitin-like protein 7 n=1 Tax=Strigamia maritima TaxID=126957 RepID=T1J358_STRMM